jgi:hypothetical protein
MSRIIQLQNSFTTGEVDPKLHSRSDIQQYAAGLATAKNVTVQPQGGVRRRDGMKFLHRISDSFGSSDAYRLVPFEYSVDESYMLCFYGEFLGDKDMIVFKNGEYVATIDMATFTDPIGSLTIRQMKWAQSADTMIITAPFSEPRKLVRGASDTDWDITKIDFKHIPKYAFDVDTHQPKFTITPSAVSGNITITASAATTDTGNAQSGTSSTVVLKSATSFTSDDAPNGMFIKITSGTGAGQTRHIEDYVYSTRTVTVYPDWDTAPDGTSNYSIQPFWEAAVDEYANVLNGFGRVRYTEYVSNTQMKGYVEIDFFDASAIVADDWESEHGYEDAWSNNRGWPHSVTFHEGRLYFAGTDSLPATFWASRVEDYFNFDKGRSLDDDAIEATISSSSLNAIGHIYSANNLQIFTSGGEFYVPQAIGEPITPTKLAVRKQTSFGSDPDVELQNVEGSTIFVHRLGKSIQEFVYDDNVQSYISPKISLFSSHLLNSPIDMAVRIGSSTEDGTQLMIVNDDGTAVCYTIYKDQGVLAATQWVTDGEIINIDVDVDDIYALVKRTVKDASNNDVVQVYCEIFDPDVLLDNTVTGTTAPSVNVSTNLRGVDVKIIRDGVVDPDQTVSYSSPSVTFVETPTESFQVGLNFETEIKTLPVEPNLPSGSIRSFKKRVLEVNADLFETQSLTINSQSVSFREFGAVSLGDPIPEYTGLKTAHGLLGYDTNAQITISQDAPLKMTVRGLDYKVSTGQ